MICGQGIWIWQIARCAHGDLERLIDAAREMPFDHVLVKCVDGTRAYAPNVQSNAYLCSRLHECGRQVIGWGFHYGRDPEAEAEAAVRSCLDLGHSLYVCNAEGEFERPDGAERARQFVEAFTEYAAGRVRLGLSTFALPSLHPCFPYAAFLDDPICDVVMPQVYTVPSRRRPYLERLETYARRAKDELGVFGKPVIPTLRAYTGDGVFSWDDIVADARSFANSEVGRTLRAWNWWSWQSAERCQAIWRLLEASRHVRA